MREMRVPNQDKVEIINQIYSSGEPFIKVLNMFDKNREGSIALQKFEEAIMWAQTMVLNNDPVPKQSGVSLIVPESTLSCIEE